MIKVLELFSGYGTATFALKRLEIPHQVIGYSDIDKYANQCFKQNHAPDGEYLAAEELGDATKINPNKLQDFDLLTGGFPCQAFSIAGKRLGELDTRGTLFNEIIRIAEVKKPKYMMLENVKGLLSKRHKLTFDKILSELDRIGYKVYWKVLNTKDYGIPQNRERVFFVCIRDDFIYDLDYEFPEKEELKICLKDILEEEVDEKYYLSESQVNSLMGGIQKSKINPDIAATLQHPGHSGGNYRGMNMIRQLNKPKHSNNRVYHTGGISPTLNTMQGGNRQPFILRGRPVMPYEPGERRLEYKRYDICPTLSQNCASGDQKNIIFKDQTIRRLTPKECFRLQGFLNDEINLKGLSDTQKYKLVGNGQSINVVEKIFKKMFALAVVSDQKEKEI